jgi:hypothetical protein
MAHINSRSNIFVHASIAERVGCETMSFQDLHFIEEQVYPPPHQLVIYYLQTTVGDSCGCYSIATP